MNDKIIEEMKQDLIKIRNDLRGCYLPQYIGAYEYAMAQDLTNLGYTKNKIPEGSVVLDRQEHQRYCAYKIIEPQIKGCLDRERELKKQVNELEEQRDRQAYIAEELIQEKHRWTEQARKETAKEIFYKLKETLIINNEENTEFFDYDYTLETIDKLAKQFGVEVEECQ